VTIAIFLGALLGAMALGVPIAFSLLFCGAALMWHMNMFDAQILAQNTIEGANSFPLLAVPFFMLAGEIMNAGRPVAPHRQLRDDAGRPREGRPGLRGHHRRGHHGGALGLGGGRRGRARGAAAADDEPRGLRHRPLRGLLASAGIIAPIIPPSIGFVIFGVAANVSISKLFMAGIAPGLMLGGALWITWWFLVRKEKIAAAPAASAKEVVAAFKDATFALVLPVIVIVGLKFGVFTPTEAAVVAAVYALFVSTAIYRELKLSQLYGLFLSAAQTTAVIMFLVAAAMVSAWMITVASLPAELVALLKPLLDSPTLLLVVIMIITMLVGTAMDMTPTILILTPVFMPLVKAAGIDPVYFGVLFMINNAIGLITPPVGTVLSTVAGVGKNQHG
jgi:TRAP-type C4-dicarboxylate transport system permease large subunit